GGDRVATQPRTSRTGRACSARNASRRQARPRSVVKIGRRSWVTTVKKYTPPGVRFRLKLGMGPPPAQTAVRPRRAPHGSTATYAYAPQIGPRLPDAEHLLRATSPS